MGRRYGGVSCVIMEEERLNENLAAASVHVDALALGKAAISRLQIWEEHLAAPMCRCF